MEALSDIEPASLIARAHTGRERTETQPTLVPRASLKRHALWTILGNGFYAGSQWLQVFVIAHLGNSSELGYFALALGLCTPVFMLCNLQLRQLQSTDAHRRYSFGDYLAARLTSSVIALAVLIVIACCSGSLKAALLILSMAAYKGFESISDIYQGFLQQRERMDYVAGSFILKGSLALCALWSAYYATHSLFCAVTSMAGAQLLTLVAYDIRSVTTIASGADWTSPWNFVRCVERPLWNRTTLMSLCVRALPLGIAMMMLSLYANVPRFVLSKYAGPSAVGIFAAISYVSMIGGMLVTAVGTAVAPRMSQYAAAERTAFYGLVAKLAGFAALLGVLGVALSALAGQWLLSALYGSEYGQYPDVLVWSMIAAALLYLTSAFGFSATAQGRIAGQPWAIAISTSVLISVAVLLVPRYGLTGAAIATVISSGVSLSCFLFLVFRRTAHDVQ